MTTMLVQIVSMVITQIFWWKWYQWYICKGLCIGHPSSAMVFASNCSV